MPKGTIYLEQCCKCDGDFPSFSRPRAGHGRHRACRTEGQACGKVPLFMLAMSNWHLPQPRTRVIKVADVLLGCSAHRSARYRCTCRKLFTGIRLPPHQTSRGTTRNKTSKHSTVRPRKATQVVLQSM